MSTITIQSEQPSKSLKILTDIPLWVYLSQGVKSPGKMSRVQAFCDLIERQHISMLKGDDDYLKGSVLEFSKTWGWDRETVVRFLDNLRQLDAIAIDMAGNRKAVKLKHVIKDENNIGVLQSPPNAKQQSLVNNST